MKPGPLLCLLGDILSLGKVTRERHQRTYHSGCSSSLERVEVVRGAVPISDHATPPSRHAFPEDVLLQRRLGGKNGDISSPPFHRQPSASAATRAVAQSTSNISPPSPLLPS